MPVRMIRTGAVVGGVVALLAAAAGCVGDIGEKDPNGQPPYVEPDPHAQTAVINGARRLTRHEYDNTLEDLLDDKTRSGFAALPEDVNDPFDNDYTTQLASKALVEAAESLAEDASARALADPAVLAKILTCTPTGPADLECLETFTRSFGRRALRRPLTDEEVSRYLKFQEFSVEGDDFLIGVDMVLRAMLQDVEFLYRVELGKPAAGTPGVFKLTGYEMATRLSYFILGTTPDEALLDLAAEGKLDTPAGVNAAAATLMQHPRARERVERFHALWLGFHQLPHTPELTASMRAETAALIDKIIFDDKTDYLDLFRATETFIDQTMADHYGLPAPSDPAGAWVDYGASGRQGILSHGTVLSAFGKFADTSPTQRGIFIRTRLMCGEIAPPPPNVNADQPPEDPNGSPCKADKYAVHIEAAGCAACHLQMDPIGFGLENYDRSGKYREHDEGLPECVITGEGAIEDVGTFKGPAELADLLTAEGYLEACVVKQAYRLALGRREGKDDLAIIDQITERFGQSGNMFDQLMIEIVSTESFGYRRQED